MADDKAPRAQLEQWISIGTTIVAPATLFGALLFYFGYVSSRSEYAYFGVDVDTIGLSTQGYIMHSPQPLLVPLLVLALFTAGIVALHNVVHRLIASVFTPAQAETDIAGYHTNLAKRRKRIQRIVQMSRAFGLVTLILGVVLLFIYGYIRNWALYALVTPLLLALGTALVAYTSRLLKLVQHTQNQPDAMQQTPAQTGSSVIAHWIASILIYVIVGASIFWATATIAQWSGLGLARYQAQHFDTLPSVILDTRERMFLRDPDVKETMLPPSQGQTFHYRYRGLRLLIEGQNRMFLVPDHWSASDSTLIVPQDSSVRIQFRFQNQRP